MSLHEYHTSLKINGEDYPFYALIMAAMRQADDDNLKRLQYVFPWVFDELQQRYDAGGGVLYEDINKAGPDHPTVFNAPDYPCSVPVDRGDYPRTEG